MSTLLHGVDTLFHRCRHFKPSVLSLKLSPGADLGVDTSSSENLSLATDFWCWHWYRHYLFSDAWIYPLTFGADVGVDTSLLQIFDFSYWHLVLMLVSTLPFFRVLGLATDIWCRYWCRHLFSQKLLKLATEIWCRYWCRHFFFQNLLKMATNIWCRY